MLEKGGEMPRREVVMEYSNLFVCLMGICTVFIGLICIILLVTVMSNIVRRTDRKMSTAEGAVPAGASAAVSARSSGANAPTGRAAAGEVTGELVAAVSAVIAEDMGTDVSGIRIVSFKKVSA